MYQNDPRPHALERILPTGAAQLIVNLKEGQLGSTLDRPTLVPALTVSSATLVAPFLVMQPAMGAGIAASKTPRPNVARLRSIVTHTAYGFGLYGSAWLWVVLTR